MKKEINPIQKTVSFIFAGVLLIVLTSSMVLPSQHGQTASAMNVVQVEDTATPTATLENTPTLTFTPTATFTPTFISGVLTCNSVVAGVTCTNYGTYLDYNININVTGLTGGATAYNINIGTYKRTTSGGTMGMMSNFVHSETSTYVSNKVFSMVRIKPFDAARVDYASFTSAAGTNVSVTNNVSDWRYIAGTGNYPNTLVVRGNVDWPITGYSIVGHIYLYSNQTFVTVTPTSTPTATRTPTKTPTSTATSTPTVTPTPNSGGVGTCWRSGPSWPVYTVYYDIVTSPLPTNISDANWISAIEAAAQTWNNVTPSHFNFVRQIGSGNIVSYEQPDNPDWLAGTAAWPEPYYEHARTRINPLKAPYDTTSPPASGAISVQNLQTHEFGHWLYLDDLDINSGCNDAMMFYSVARGSGYRLNLSNFDINGINYQYP